MLEKDTPRKKTTARLSCAGQEKAVTGRIFSSFPIHFP